MPKPKKTTQEITKQINCPVLGSVASLKLIYEIFNYGTSIKKDKSDFFCEQCYVCGISSGTLNSSPSIDWAKCPEHENFIKNGDR
jgi:hypothetical protein